MPDINIAATAVAALVAFVAAFVYYVLNGKLYRQLSPAAQERSATRPSAGIPIIELAKHCVLAVVVSGLIVKMDVTTWWGACIVALALWIGFPVILLLGSVVHEKVPWRLAVLHAGDWLIKLLLIAAVVGTWS